MEQKPTLSGNHSPANGLFRLSSTSTIPAEESQFSGGILVNHILGESCTALFLGRKQHVWEVFVLLRKMLSVGFADRNKRPAVWAWCRCASPHLRRHATWTERGGAGHMFQVIRCGCRTVWLCVGNVIQPEQPH